MRLVFSVSHLASGHASVDLVQRMPPQELTGIDCNSYIFQHVVLELTGIQQGFFLSGVDWNLPQQLCHVSKPVFQELLGVCLLWCLAEHIYQELAGIYNRSNVLLNPFFRSWRESTTTTTMALWTQPTGSRCLPQWFRRTTSRRRTTSWRPAAWRTRTSRPWWHCPRTRGSEKG